MDLFITRFTPTDSKILSMASEELPEDYDSLLKKNKLLLNQISFLNDELCKTKKDLENEKQKHEEDIETSKSDLKHMIEETVELKKQLQTAKDDLDDVENQFINMVGNKSLRNENLSLRKDLRALKQKCDELATQYEMVRDEYNSAIFESNDLRQKVATQQTELLLKTSELKKAWRELEKNREDMALMMREFAEFKQHDDEPTNWKKMEEENHELKNEIEKVKRQNDTLSVLLNEFRMEIARINEQSSTLPSLSDDAPVEADGETLESKGIQSSLFSPEDVNSALTLCINSLTVLTKDFNESESQDLIRRISSLMLVKKQLIVVNDNTSLLIHRDDQHRKALMEKEAKIDELEGEIQSLKANMDTANTQISSQSRELSEMKQRLEGRNREIAMVKEDQALAWRQNSASGDSQIAQLQQRLQEASELRSGLMRERDDLAAQLAQEKLDNEDLKREVAKLKKENEETEARLMEVTTIQLELAAQQDSHADQEQTITDLRSKLEEISAANAKLMDEKMRLLSDFTVQITDLKRKLTDREDEIDDLEDSLDNEKDATEKLRKENKELVEVRDHLRSDVKELEADNDDLREQLERFNERSKQNQDTEQRYQRVLSENTKLKAQLDATQQQLESLQRQVESLPLIKDIPQCEDVQGEVKICRESMGMCDV